MTSAIDTSGADLLVVAVSWFLPQGAATITDSKSNSWTALTEQDNPSRSALRIFYSKPTSVGTGHTFTGSDTADFHGSIMALAFSGTASASVFDQQNGGANAGSGATTVSTGSVTPTADGELLVAAYLIDDPANTGAPKFTIDSSMTIQEQQDVVPGSIFGGVVATRIQGTAAAVNATLTRSNANTGSGPDLARIATFKAAVTGLPPGFGPDYSMDEAMQTSMAVAMMR